MEVMWLVLPLALGPSVGAVLVFAWAVRRGQSDDLESPDRLFGALGLGPPPGA